MTSHPGRYGTDPFVGHRSHHLAFLDAPPPRPGTNLAVLRGSSRIFDLAGRAGANAMSDHPASPPTRTPESQHQPAAADVRATGIPDGFGIDLDGLGPAQLGALMAACIERLASEATSALAAAQRHEP
ncbi:MAG: hypothetical protein OEO77_13690 [Acidimicrobiia bacterium]|nr:hypothetical protein [Acidimicrobiia bacterium]